jgi:hypothetical protein
MATCRRLQTPHVVTDGTFDFLQPRVDRCKVLQHWRSLATTLPAWRDAGTVLIGTPGIDADSVDALETEFRYSYRGGKIPEYMDGKRVKGIKW